MKKELTLLENSTIIIQDLKERFLNGEIDIKEYARVLFFAKKLETLTKDKKIREMALNEFSKYPEKEGEYMGIKWTYKNGSGRYNYEQDGEYAALKEQKDKIEELMKQRAELLKTATNYYKQGRELVVDGEVIPPVEYVSYSDSISVK